MCLIKVPQSRGTTSLIIMSLYYFWLDGSIKIIMEKLLDENANAIKYPTICNQMYQTGLIFEKAIE